MRLDRLISLGLVRPFRRISGREPDFRRSLPVLMYHSISDDPEPAFSPYYKICTSPRRFSEQMQWLAESGWRGVTLSEGLERLNERQPKTGPKQKPERGNADAINISQSSAAAQTNDNLVAITFDDGFRDFHTAAFSTLRQHGFSATMYVPTAFIGDERKSFKSRECLTWAEVRSLHESGIEFGSHTVTHPALVNLSWPEIETELRDSKAALEQRLNQPVRTFAYPYAFPQMNHGFRVRFLEILRSTGYESCTTTEIGTVVSGDELLQLKRLPANACDDMALFQAKLEGAYDWMRWPQNTMKRIKSLRLPPLPAHSRS